MPQYYLSVPLWVKHKSQALTGLLLLTQLLRARGAETT